MGMPPAEQIAAAREMMARAAADVEAGKPVDLAPFEAQVREFCDALMALPRSESEHFREELEELVAELGKLSRDMTRRRDALRNEIHGLSRQAQAQQAYARAAGMKKPEPGDTH